MLETLPQRHFHLEGIVGEPRSVIGTPDTGAPRRGTLDQSLQSCWEPVPCPRGELLTGIRSWSS